MWHGVPFVIIFLPIVWFVLITVFKPEIKELKTVKHNPNLSKEQKQVLYVFGFTILLWLTTKIHGFSSATVSLVPIILLYLFKLLSERDFKEVNWPVLILIGGGLSLGLAMHASGLDLEIANLLQTIAVGQGVLVTYLIIGAFGIILTVFASNTAAGAVFIPIMVPLSLMLGMDLRALVVLAGISVSLDYIVPVGTPPSAIAYSSGYVKVRDMAKTGVILAILGILLLGVMALSYWGL
ncbi:SLC13 family permease, partial [Candidatus Aenigmatarchaeota archaeon]